MRRGTYWTLLPKLPPFVLEVESVVFCETLVEKEVLVVLEDIMLICSG
jgi:hypothetical protein